jgi:hypothetical protein
MRVGIRVDISARGASYNRSASPMVCPGAGLLWVIPCVGFLGSAHGPLAND